MTQDKKSKTKKKQRTSIKPLKRLLGYLGPYKKWFIPSAVALVITASMALAFPFFIKDLIGGAMSGSDLDVEHVTKNLNRVAIVPQYD